MGVVPRENGNGACLQCHGSHPVDLDDQLARSDIVVADEFLWNGKEGREMAGRELGRDAEVPAEFPVYDHASPKAKRAQDIVQNVHQRLRRAYVCGVSVKLSGKPVMFANGSEV